MHVFVEFRFVGSAPVVVEERTVVRTSGYTTGGRGNPHHTLQLDRSRTRSAGEH